MKQDVVVIVTTIICDYNQKILLKLQILVIKTEK